MIYKDFPCQQGYERYATIFRQLGHHIAEQRLAPLYDRSMWYIFDAHMCICLHIIKNHIIGKITLQESVAKLYVNHVKFESKQTLNNCTLCITTGSAKNLYDFQQPLHMLYTYVYTCIYMAMDTARDYKKISFPNCPYKNQDLYTYCHGKTECSGCCACSCCFSAVSGRWSQVSTQLTTQPFPATAPQQTWQLLHHSRQCPHICFLH